MDQKGSDFFDGSSAGLDKALEEFLGGSPGGRGDPGGGIIGPFSLAIDWLVRMHSVAVPGFFDPSSGGPAS